MEIGIDIEEIERIKKACKKWSNRFLNKIYSKREVEYCFKKSNPYESLAGRFCAKEAVIKVFEGKIFFSDIEIINKENGKPEVYINNKKADGIKLSISHTKRYATAVALKE